MSFRRMVSEKRWEYLDPLLPVNGWQWSTCVFTCKEQIETGFFPLFRPYLVVHRHGILEKSEGLRRCMDNNIRRYGVLLKVIPCQPGSCLFEKFVARQKQYVPPIRAEFDIQVSKRSWVRGWPSPCDMIKFLPIKRRRNPNICTLGENFREAFKLYLDIWPFNAQTMSVTYSRSLKFRFLLFYSHLAQPFIARLSFFGVFDHGRTREEL